MQTLLRLCPSDGSGGSLEGRSAPLMAGSVVLIIFAVLLLCSRLSTHPREVGELSLVPRASLFPSRRAQPLSLATRGCQSISLLTTPAEDVDMLRDVCVNGFYFVSLGLDISRGFLGWGQAAFFLCSSSSFDKWRVYHWWCHWDPPMMHGVLCVRESCFGRSVCKWSYSRSGVRKRHWLVGRGENIVTRSCDKAKWIE